MKIALCFVLVALSVYLFRTVMTKRERRNVVKGASAWLIPLLLAAVVITAAIFFQLHFNGKVI